MNYCIWPSDNYLFKLTKMIMGTEKFGCYSWLVLRDKTIDKKRIWVILYKYGQNKRFEIVQIKQDKLFDEVDSKQLFLLK